MEENIEIAIFMMSMVWFIIIAGVFLVFIRTSMQRDDMEHIRKVNDEANLKIIQIHRSLKDIKKS
jgi:hypothetical protein